ncbi:MAG: helix-turn-helix domain-containing protein [Bacteroidales bacterium]|nr:helix-turn-helix domain-containing protein [Bacteroidales bacterium]
MDYTQIYNKLAKIEKLIEDNTLNTKEFLNFSEAARYLNISQSLLYKMTSKREIVFYKPRGKIIFFMKKDLDAWITRNRIKSQDEIEQIANKHINKF